MKKLKVIKRIIASPNKQETKFPDLEHVHVWATTKGNRAKLIKSTKNKVVVETTRLSLGDKILLEYTYEQEKS